MTERRRLAGVDAARGLALVGMASVHVFPAEADDGGETTAHVLAAGRSAALFAVLAGVGIALATGWERPVRGGDRARWSAALVLRALVVGAVGLLLGALESGVAVILAYYAVLFVLALPLLGFRPRVLLPVAAVLAVAVPVASQAGRDEMGTGLRRSPTFETLLEAPRELAETLLLTGYYPVLAWTAYLAAGLAVGRLALARRTTALALLGGGATLAVAASLTSALLLGPLGGLDAVVAAGGDLGADPGETVQRGRFGTVPTTTWWWLATDAPHSTTPLDLLHTTGTALAALGAALLLASTGGRRLLTPLAAAGSMPLTLYSLHVVVLATFEDDDPLLFWGVQVVAALVLATAWQRLVGRGPLEALLAAMTRAVTRRT